MAQSKQGKMPTKEDQRLAHDTKLQVSLLPRLLRSSVSSPLIAAKSHKQKL